MFNKIRESILLIQPTSVEYWCNSVSVTIWIVVAQGHLRGGSDDPYRMLMYILVVLR